MAVNRQPDYTVDELRDLKFHNKFVQVWLWAVIVLFLVIFIASNQIARRVSISKRKLARQYAGEKRPSNACARTGKGCTRWVPGTVIAIVRKFAYRRTSKIALILGMSTSSQVIVIGAYWIINLILVVGGARGNIDYMAHHAARLSNANLPLIIGLASKNNVISYATGIEYESLNVFHRWSARLFLVLSTIHGIGRIYINVPVIDFNASPPPNDPQGYLYAGTVGYFLFALMILGAARSIRNRFYSFFIFSHIVALAGALAAVVIHRPSIAGWIYAGIAIYLVDRIWRTIRLIHRQVFSKVTKDDLGDHEDIGLVEALDEGTMRVTVKSTMNWIPGQHIFLHVPFISAGGHPFSICAIDRPMDQIDDPKPRVSTIVLLIRVREGVTRKLWKLAMGDPERALRYTSCKDRPALPAAELSPIWAEGPYGNLTHFDYFPTVLLVAGGTGVSFCLPIMMDIIRRARSMRLGGSEAVATERLTFVWIVKEKENIEWIGDALRQAVALAPPSFLRLHIHVTSKSFQPPQMPLAISPPLHDTAFTLPKFLPSPQQSQSAVGRLVESTLPLAHGIMAAIPSPASNVVPPLSPSSNTSSPTLLSGRFSGVSLNSMDEDEVNRVELPLKAGRPDLKAILDAEIEATDYSDHISVGCCGPLGMTSELGNIVSEAIWTGRVLRGEHRRNILLHTEEYGW